MTDYEDYENNLAFPPQGDWADTSPRANTDRTLSSIELVNKIEELTKWLDLKSEYAVKIEDENIKLKKLLNACRDAMNDDKYWQQCDLIKQIDELLGEDNAG